MEVLEVMTETRGWRLKSGENWKLGELPLGAAFGNRLGGSFTWSLIVSLLVGLASSALCDELCSVLGCVVIAQIFVRAAGEGLFGADTLICKRCISQAKL